MRHWLMTSWWPWVWAGLVVGLFGRLAVEALAGLWWRWRSRKGPGEAILELVARKRDEATKDLQARINEDLLACSEATPSHEATLDEVVRLRDRVAELEAWVNWYLDEMERRGRAMGASSPSTITSTTGTGMARNLQLEVNQLRGNLQDAVKQRDELQWRVNAQVGTMMKQNERLNDAEARVRSLSVELAAERGIAPDAADRELGLGGKS